MTFSAESACRSIHIPCSAFECTRLVGRQGNVVGIILWQIRQEFQLAVVLEQATHDVLSLPILLLHRDRPHLVAALSGRQIHNVSQWLRAANLVI